MRGYIVPTEAEGLLALRAIEQLRGPTEVLTDGFGNNPRVAPTKEWAPLIQLLNGLYFVPVGRVGRFPFFEQSVNLGPDGTVNIPAAAGVIDAGPALLPEDPIPSRAASALGSGSRLRA